MRRAHLVAHLRSNGCDLLRHGGKHDFWHNRVTGAVTSVPRHREIPYGTVRAICRDLGVPPPPGR